MEVLLLDAREPCDELRRNFTCWLGCQVRCLEVLVGHHVQLQLLSGLTTDHVPVRATQPNKYSFSSLVQLASGSNEPVSFLHRVKSSVTRAVQLASGSSDPGGEQWAKGPEVSVNLHRWSRRSALQVRDCARTSDFHRVSQVEAAADEHLQILAIREHIQRACGSEERKYR